MTCSVLSMCRRTLPDGTTRTHLDRISNRLTKILAKAKRVLPQFPCRPDGSK
jgi:hypothetical protein